jgi:hypothetical protein
MPSRCCNRKTLLPQIRYCTQEKLSWLRYSSKILSRTFKPEMTACRPLRSGISSRCRQSSLLDAMIDAGIDGMQFGSYRWRATPFRASSVGVFLRHCAHNTMKPVSFTFLGVAGLMIGLLNASDGAEPARRADVTPRRAAAPVAQSARIAATRVMLLERKKALRDQLQKSMPLHEERVRDQEADYEMKRELYEKNLISKHDLEGSARALTAARVDAERVRDWIAEDERALTLAAQAAEESKEPPRRGAKQDLATAAVMRFDGAASWSVDAFEKIDSFYRRQFGRPPPVSAMGQSHTHDRLGLDHRDAVDVAVRPDSAEGRALIAYLRRAGIPFIAFYGKLSSMSTGAHINICRPSSRLLEVKQQRPAAPARADGAEHG